MIRIEGLGFGGLCATGQDNLAHAMKSLGQNCVIRFEQPPNEELERLKNAPEYQAREKVIAQLEAKYLETHPKVSLGDMIKIGFKMPKNTFNPIEYMRIRTDYIKAHPLPQDSRIEEIERSRLILL